MNVECRLMQPIERDSVAAMMRGGADVDERVIQLFETYPSQRYVPFVALDGYGIVGMVTGSTDSDFNVGGGWETFEMPAGPHGYMDRLYVAPLYRGFHVGSSLVRAYAEYAASCGVTMIGGAIDRSSPDRDRRAFFAACGFRTGGRIEGHDYNIAATPQEVIDATRRLDVMAEPE